jgi:gamma-glutamyltranspeptidase/glutathione hydrolase
LRRHQPPAAQAGLALLARGGNAVDAAIATAVALTVVEPVTNGIGSDAFAIVASGGAARRTQRLRPFAGRLD